VAARPPQRVAARPRPPPCPPCPPCQPLPFLSQPSAGASCRSTLKQTAEHLMEHGQGGRISSSGRAWAHMRADGGAGRPTAARGRVPHPLKGRRDGPWCTRAAMGREAGGRACLLWVLWMHRRVSCVSIVFCVSESSLHAVGCVCRMGPRTAVSYVPYVSLLRSIRAFIYWYVGIIKGTRRVVSASATFYTHRPRESGRACARAPRETARKALFASLLHCFSKPRKWNRGPTR